MTGDEVLAGRNMSLTCGAAPESDLGYMALCSSFSGSLGAWCGGGGAQAGQGAMSGYAHRADRGAEAGGDALVGFVAQVVRHECFAAAGCQGCDGRLQLAQG